MSLRACCPASDGADVLPDRSKSGIDSPYRGPLRAAVRMVIAISQNFRVAERLSENSPLPDSEDMHCGESQSNTGNS